jgi:hypothetical protein
MAYIKDLFRNIIIFFTSKTNKLITLARWGFTFVP